MNKQNEMCLSFAKGDFSSLANCFQQAGFWVEQPCAGVMQICADNRSDQHNEARPRLLISVGIHGDETVPIEIMALLLAELSKTPQCLAVDLMIAVGNLGAIAQAKRFIDVDLNRLFVPGRLQFNQPKEAQRADQLMQVTQQFFEGQQNKWHLDLHSAIRASVYPRFAIVPGKVPAKNTSEFLYWLRTAGISAVVLNPKISTHSATFSSYTYTHSGAISCTAELGRIGELGTNDLTQFAITQHALSTLIRSGLMNQELPDQTSPIIFRVVQELIKQTDAFEFTFDSNTPNFTEFAPKTVLARDDEITWSVGANPEYVLFPNADVHVGLRTALMVVRLPEVN